MALYDGFFDAVYDEVEEKFDREYDSGAFVDYFYQFIGNGVCVYNNPDSFLVRLRDGAAVIAPGYLFLQGYWLKNTEDYVLAVPGSGRYAIVAHLNKGKRLFEILTRDAVQNDPDSLVLAYVNIGAGTVEDMRYNTDICGVIDAAGSLTGKVQYILNFIDTQIEAKLRAAEELLQAKARELDAQIAEVKRIAESIAPPPVGSIKYSAAADPGEGWLRCDGSYISETEYPELVSVLGKLTPGNTEIKYIMSPQDCLTASNMAIFNDWLCVLYQSKRTGYYILQKDLNASGGVKSLHIVSFANIKNNLPIYLSIANGTLFLTQRAGNDIYIFMKKNFNSVNIGEEIIFEEYNARNYLEPIFSQYQSAYMVPYIIYQDGCYYMMAAANRTSNGTIVNNRLYYLKFTSFQDITYGSCAVAHSNYWASMLGSVGDYEPLSLLGFSEKNNQECVYANTLNGIPGSNCVFNSIIKNIYNIAGSDTNSNGLPTFPVYCLPVVGGDQIFLGLGIYGDHIIVASARHGGKYTRIKAPIKLPSAASTFYDSAAYIPNQQIWLIFVGTGFVMAKNLENASDIGYLDTTKAISPSGRYAHTVYDAERKTLYVSCMKPNDSLYVYGFQMDDDFFHYSSTGTWLPTLSYNSIPAYIKAKGDAR